MVQHHAVRDAELHADARLLTLDDVEEGRPTENPHDVVAARGRETAHEELIALTDRQIVERARTGCEVEGPRAGRALGVVLADADDLKHADAEGRIVDDAPAGGFYLAPRLVGPADPPDRLAQEEIFGPVQVVMAFDGEADAVAQANGTAYGLVAGVWTRDGSRALRMARKLQCGQVFVNNYGAGGGIELPFGGVKHSGHGREKGFEALYGFSVLKTVALKHD